MCSPARDYKVVGSVPELVVTLRHVMEKLSLFWCSTVQTSVIHKSVCVQTRTNLSVHLFTFILAFGIQQIWDDNSLRKKNEAAVNVEIGRFDNNRTKLSSSAVPVNFALLCFHWH